VKERGFKEYTPFSVALNSVISNVKSLSSISLPFNRAAGFVTAENIVAYEDIPPFDRAAVDGFAVRASDTFRASFAHPVKLRVVEGVFHKRKGKFSLKRKEAVRVATGAPLPNGADAVVMVEYTKSSRDSVAVFQPVSPGKNVSAKGEDVKNGETIIRAGTLLRPQEIGMLAALRRLRVRVIPKPKVAVITTGAELASPWKDRKKSEIIDVNIYSLSAAVIESGGAVGILRRIPDDYELLKKEISKALKHDIVLISGGSSVGEFDFAPDVLRRLGKIVFHGVATRPASPTAFGLVKNKPVFCLPGFPAASIISFRLFVRPALMKLQGLPPTYGRRVLKAKLARKVGSTLGRTDILRVKLRTSKGETIADPIRITGSGILSSLTRADGFVLIPENVEGLAKDEEVEVELF